MENKVVHNDCVFLNAQEMRIKYPDTFYAPSYEDLEELKTSDIVKICQCFPLDESGSNERYWVEIISIDEGKIIGSVANDLVISPLNYGDLVTFTKENIYDIF